VDGFSDAIVRPAAADIARHGAIDVGVRGRAVGREQRGGRHDLTGLTVTALRHGLLDPRGLKRVRAVRRQPLDGRDRPVADRRDRRRARADGPAIEMNGARAALRDAAPELGAREVQNVAEDPEKRRIRLDVDLLGAPVHA
jgi:hypothetical protein